MATKTRLEGFLQEAALNVPARDACCVIKGQIEVIHLAMVGVAKGSDEPDAYAGVQAMLYDVYEAVSELSEAPGLRPLRIVEPVR
jgi:hypothetical protein